MKFDSWSRAVAKIPGTHYNENHNIMVRLY